MKYLYFEKVTAGLEIKGTTLRKNKTGYQHGLRRNLWCKKCPDVSLQDMNVSGYYQVFLGSCCGIAPTFWKGGQWICSECDGAVVYNESKQLDFNNLFDGPVVPKVCDCGGAKVKTTCANWCSTKDGK